MITGIHHQTIRAEDGEAVVVLRPLGELDLASIASLDSAVTAALRAAGPQPKLIVDLSEVSLLAPVIVGVLLDARRRCRDAAGAMALVVSAPELAEGLADMEIASLFVTATDLQAALLSVSQH